MVIETIYEDEAIDYEKDTGKCHDVLVCFPKTPKKGRHAIKDFYTIRGTPEQSKVLLEFLEDIFTFDDPIHTFHILPEYNTIPRGITTEENTKENLLRIFSSLKIGESQYNRILQKKIMDSFPEENTRTFRLPRGLS